VTYAHGVPASGGHDFKFGCFRIWTPYSLFLAKGLEQNSVFQTDHKTTANFFNPMNLSEKRLDY